MSFNFIPILNFWIFFLSSPLVRGSIILLLVQTKSTMFTHWDKFSHRLYLIWMCLISLWSYFELLIFLIIIMLKSYGKLTCKENFWNNTSNPLILYPSSTQSTQLSFKVNQNRMVYLIVLQETATLARVKTNSEIQLLMELPNIQLTSLYPYKTTKTFSKCKPRVSIPFKYLKTPSRSSQWEWLG